MDAKPKGVFTPQEYMRLTGCIVIATFLAQAVFQQKQNRVHQRTDDQVRFNGWFYNTRDQWLEQTGLSRSQQERARKWLKEHGLLSERRQRLNVGIIIWYRVDRDKLYRLLNGLAERSTVNMDVQTETEKEKGAYSYKTDLLIKVIKPYKSKSITPYKTIVPKTPIKALYNAFKRENGTNVSDIKTTIRDKDSVNHCLTKKTKQVSTNTTAKAPKKPTTPSTPSSLIGRPDNNQRYQAALSDKPKHSFNADDYQSCHPYIYLWAKNVLTGLCRGISSVDELKTWQHFNAQGFQGEMVLDSLGDFIQTYGTIIQARYEKLTPLPITDLTVDDMRQAQACSMGQTFYQDTTNDVQKINDQLTVKDG